MFLFVCSKRTGGTKEIHRQEMCRPVFFFFVRKGVSQRGDGWVSTPVFCIPRPVVGRRATGGFAQGGGGLVKTGH